MQAIGMRLGMKHLRSLALTRSVDAVFGGNAQHIYAAGSNGRASKGVL
jgi:hypothetical protein